MHTMCPVCQCSLGEHPVRWQGMDICHTCSGMSTQELALAYAITANYNTYWVTQTLDNPTFIRAITGGRK